MDPAVYLPLLVAVAATVVLGAGVVLSEDPGAADMDRADDAERSTWPIA